MTRPRETSRPRPFPDMVMPDCSAGHDALARMAAEVHGVNVDKGWFDDERSFGDMIALLHSEVSEALEAFRDHGLTDATRRAPTDEEIHDHHDRHHGFEQADQNVCEFSLPTPSGFPVPNRAKNWSQSPRNSPWEQTHAVTELHPGYVHPDGCAGCGRQTARTRPALLAFPQNAPFVIRLCVGCVLGLVLARPVRALRRLILSAGRVA